MLPAPPPPPGAAAARSYRSWIWSGAILIVLGVIGIVGWVIYGVIDVDRTVDDMVRAREGTAVGFILDSDRDWTVYLEPQSADLSGLRFDLLDPVGDQVEMRPYGGRSTYSVTGHSGWAVATVALEAGEHQLVVDGSGSRWVAVGPSIAGRIGTIVIWSIVMGVVLIGGGAALAIVGALRQSRARNRRATPPPPSAWANGEWNSPGASRSAQ